MVSHGRFELLPLIFPGAQLLVQVTPFCSAHRVTNSTVNLGDNPPPGTDPD